MPFSLPYSFGTKPPGTPQFENQVGINFKQIADGPFLTRNGTSGNTDYFWSNNGIALVNRLQDRLFVGSLACANDGKVPASGDWVTALGSSASQNSQLFVSNTLGMISILGATRSSDWPTNGQASNSVSIWGFGLNNNTDNTADHGVWGGYFEAGLDNAGAKGGALGIEVDAWSKCTNPVEIFPYSMFGGTSGNVSAAVWLASGAQVGTTDISAGIAFLSNSTRFLKGIVFESDALTTSKGFGGLGVAMEMAAGQVARWMDNTNASLVELFGTTDGTYTRRGSGVGGVANFMSGGGDVNIRIDADSPSWIGTTTTHDFGLRANNATILTAQTTGLVKFAQSASFSANGSVATVLGSIGPTGSHTTVQKWLTIVDNSGATGYIPVF